HTALLGDIVQDQQHTLCRRRPQPEQIAGDGEALARERVRVRLEPGRHVPGELMPRGIVALVDRAGLLTRRAPDRQNDLQNDDDVDRGDEPENGDYLDHSRFLLRRQGLRQRGPPDGPGRAPDAVPSTRASAPRSCPSAVVPSGASASTTVNRRRSSGSRIACAANCSVSGTNHAAWRAAAPARATAAYCSNSASRNVPFERNCR